MHAVRKYVHNAQYVCTTVVPTARLRPSVLAACVAVAAPGAEATAAFTVALVAAAVSGPWWKDFTRKRAFLKRPADYPKGFPHTKHRK